MNERALQIAEELQDAAEWAGDLCGELCALAGMEDEWASANGETFERIVAAAADALGVEIFRGRNA